MDMDVGFGDIVSQAEKLTADIDNGVDLPRVDRSLPQIMEIAQRMSGKSGALSQDSSQMKASLLLGPRGYDVQKMTQLAENLHTIKSFEPIESIRDTDIQGFLKNERENALLAAIEHTRKTTFENVEKQHWDCVLDEWEREKQRILNALVGTTQEVLDVSQEPDVSMTPTPVHTRGRSAMNNVELAYARQVYVYNEALIHGGSAPSLTKLFCEVAEKHEDKNAQNIWKIVRYLTDIPMVTMSSDMVSVRTSLKMQQAITSQALKFLEDSYMEHMMNSVSSNLQQAELGGVPGTYPLVRSYLSVKLPSGAHAGLEDGLLDGHPVWAMVYYCLRAGDMQAVQQVVDSAQQQLHDLVAYASEYTRSEERRLSQSSETKLRLLYRRNLRNCQDPFKRAVYCIMGRCDPFEDHSEVAEKTDDYMWIKLKQISFDDTDVQSQDQLTLPQLQTILLEEYGEHHFGGYKQPFLYFRVLLLSGQFEAAIEFFSRSDVLRCHAIHVALVLHEIKVLLLPQNIQTQILSKQPGDPSPVRRLNFARLVTLYTRKFESTDPREALQYFYFLRNFKDTQGENLFMTCASELVLETREFEMLLGKLGRDGSRLPGAIDKFNPDTHKIIELVAKDTENKGLFEDAVKLYDLAKNYDRVLELLSKLLSEVLSQRCDPQSNKERLKNLALSIAERYRSLNLEGTRANTSTFYLLLDLLTFYDLYHAGNLDRALTVIKELKLLPFTADAIEQKVKAFKHLTDEIRRCLPDLLLATMDVLHAQYKATRRVPDHMGVSTLASDSGFSMKQDGSNESCVAYLRSQAQALITFAGMIPYRMPGDMYARLVQIEVLMN